MAFKSILKFANKEFDVLDCTYRFARDIDSKGSPSSPIYGGKVYLHIESTEDSLVLEHMLNQFKPHSGTVIFKKGDEDSKMKELVWENGYTIEYDESLNSIGMHPMTIRFVISAQKLSVGNAQFEANWPR